MATLAQFRTQIDALVTPALDATGITWSDAAEDVGRDYRVPAGEARLQILPSMASENNEVDSTQNYLEAEALVTIAYHATTAALRSTWVQTHLDAVLRVFVDRSAWRDGMAAVYEVVGGPEAGTPRIEGNVVFIEVSARVQLAA